MNELGCTYVALLLVLLGFALNTFYLTWVSVRSRRLSRASPAAPAGSAISAIEWPSVLIQLPVFNEPEVIERLLSAVAAIEYPGRIELQILDDSTDSTPDLIDAFLASSSARFQHLRRGSRAGFKAGALAFGLERSRADLVAILDADFVPASDFLLRLVPELVAAPELGFVQARWGFLNRSQSLLTRLIAHTLSLHFSIEQHARSQGGFILNFNGTAGIIRRSAIEAAGGWEGDTLTEDMDLSYRMACVGYRGKFIADYSVPSEIPSTFRAFRMQQRRWIQGGLQTAIKLGGRLLHSPRLSRGEKLQAFLHLFHGLVYPLALASSLIAVPVILKGGFRVHWNPLFWLFLTFSLGVQACYFVAELATLRGDGGAPLPGKGKNLSKADWHLIPAVGLLGASLALSNSLAVMRALSGQASLFVRTPKRGSAAQSSASPSGQAPTSVWHDRYAWVSSIVATLILITAFQAASEFRSWIAISFFTLGVGYALPMWIRRLGFE